MIMENIQYFFNKFKNIFFEAWGNITKIIDRNLILSEVVRIVLLILLLIILINLVLSIIRYITS